MSSSPYAHFMTFYPNPIAKKTLQLVLEFLWPKNYCICSSFTSLLNYMSYVPCALGVVVPDVPLALRALLSNLPHALHVLVPDVPRVLRALVSRVPHALRDLMPLVLRAFVHHFSCTLGALALFVPHFRFLICNILMHLMSRSSCVLHLFCCWYFGYLSFFRIWVTINHYAMQLLLKVSYYNGLF